MAIIREVKSGGRLMGKLTHGADLLEELTSICKDHDIRLGRVEALGAVQKARVGFYDQKEREYRFMDLDEPLEILNVTGNVSVKEGEPIIHAHITLGDSKGNTFGGHLAPGTIVFACEYIIEILNGEELTRGYDDETGLPLWVKTEDS